MLAYGENVGYTIFESYDQKQLMHLGHPEYTVHRIISEIERDKEKEMFLLLKILIQIVQKPLGDLIGICFFGNGFGSVINKLVLINFFNERSHP